MSFDVFDSELCAIVELGPDGIVRRAGRGWSAVFEWPADAVTGEPITRLCDPDHAERFETALDNLSKGAPSAIVRARFRIEARDLLLSCRLEPHDDAIYLVAEDVGERQAVVPVESQLRSLVDFAFDAWMVHDLEGRIIDANPWAYKSLGYTREELLNLRVADFETTIQPGRMDGIWNRMEVGKPETVEGLQKRKDGTTFPVEVRLGLFTTEEDDVLMLAICRDITERKKQEQALADSNEELQRLNEHLEEEVAARTREVRTALAERQAMLDNLVDGIVAVNAAGEIQFANPALVELLGLDAITPGVTADLVLPTPLSVLIREATRSGDVASDELSLPRDRIGAAVVSPVTTADAFEGAVALVRDVTIEKEIDRMKTDFIATVSHELRTPLTSVLGFAKLIKNKLERTIFEYVPEDDARAMRAAEQIRGNIDIVVSEGERLTALINDVLDISKMEGGHMEWRLETIEPERLVTRALEATHGLFADVDVELRSEIADDLPTLRGDPDRLQQVLINLIANASKFTEEGSVTVSARVVAETVEFSVTDTGVGIDADEQASIFEKFKQVGDTLTSKPRGTGLGLPICRQIVAAHDGEIWAESEPGEGARFAFTIPVRDRASDAAAGLSALMNRIDHEVRGTDGDTPEILIVDDDPSLRELLRQQLAGNGYTVREASNGYEAIEMIRDRRPDLVILDVMMPHLSGFDVAALLKSDPRTEAIPIIILSILTDEDRGLRLGVDRYLTKPTTPEQLGGAIEDLLREKRSPRRVLVVDGEQSAGGDIARLLESKGYEVVGRCTGADCLEQARKTKPQMIIVEELVDEHHDLVRTIRFARDLEHVLVVQLLGGEGAESPEEE